MRSSVADTCGRQGGCLPCDGFGSSLPVPPRAAPGRRCAPVAGQPPTVARAPTPPAPTRTAFPSSCTRPPSWGLCPTQTPPSVPPLLHQIVRQRHEPQAMKVLHSSTPFDDRRSRPHHQPDFNVHVPIAPFRSCRWNIAPATSYVPLSPFRSCVRPMAVEGAPETDCSLRCSRQTRSPRFQLRP